MDAAEAGGVERLATVQPQGFAQRGLARLEQRLPAPLLAVDAWHLLDPPDTPGPDCLITAV